MTEQTSSSVTIEADPATIMSVIADFEAYPSWAAAVKEVEVLSTYPDGRAKEVHFVLNAGAIKDEYTLAYTWDGNREVRWSLVEGKVVKRLDGSYTLRDRGRGKTEVTYRLAVDVTFPMLGLIKRKAEKVIIDTALKELKKKVEG
ncbi:SRPBCC family protein [Thermasporomyces composti]|uniref:Polyketide cyclase/dehydrase/lipid transport protein n=1 Tax=Thermasporomyces composti TaxID=696763 RepID=A0A3D9UZF5_THECX|nr:SRPBCC family protein [Thermasporomyces composti]REF34878.1 polyketide cyclase/dehydrase/lipid transport protein [Thermasporomyces composti]